MTVHGHPRGLAYDRKGRLVATLGRAGLLVVVQPTYEVLVSSFKRQTLGYPNDVVADSKGGIYFTDPLNSLHSKFRPPPPNRKGMVFYVKPDGSVVSVIDDIESNGVILSPDEKILYTTDEPEVVVHFENGHPEHVVRPRVEQLDAVEARV